MAKLPPRKGVPYRGKTMPLEKVPKQPVASSTRSGKKSKTAKKK